MSFEDHPEPPRGPLAVRWARLTLEPPEAGTLVEGLVALRNSGSADWRDVGLSYHWLDDRGNPIVWDGLRTPVALRAGAEAEVRLAVRAPIPPARYRLALDLVVEHRFWFGELGNHVPELELDVLPRDAGAARAFLAHGAEPAGEWHERVRRAHQLGYAAVGGSIDAGGPADELAAYAPGGGRNPAFGRPLVCPSLLPPLEPNEEVAGLPAWRPEGDEPWLYDGRIRLRLRSGRRPGGR